MRAPLVLVTGVGTGVGKTHVAEALLMRWARHARVAGFKPIETGVSPGGPQSDGDRLEAASTFHVKHSEVGLRFPDPVSPHLAAEKAGRAIDPAAIVARVETLRTECDGLVVELAGGLFSPVLVGFLNVDLVRALAPTVTVLVAPDRLGVLHDVLATTHAAADLTTLLVLLVSPASADTSTGSNARELRRLQARAVLGPVGRGAARVLADDDAIAACLGAAEG